MTMRIVYHREYGEGCHGYVVRLRPERFVVVERDGLRVYVLDDSGAELDLGAQPENAEAVDLAIIAAASTDGALGCRTLRVARAYVDDVAKLFLAEALP
jgi:hypothetical protein